MILARTSYVAPDGSLVESADLADGRTIRVVGVDMPRRRIYVRIEMNNWIQMLVRKML